MCYKKTAYGCYITNTNELSDWFVEELGRLFYRAGSRTVEMELN
jgi:hypothetical protein